MVWMPEDANVGGECLKCMLGVTGAQSQSLCDFLVHDDINFNAASSGSC